MNTRLIRLFIVVPFISFISALGQVEIVPKWFDGQDSITIRYSSADQECCAERNEYGLWPFWTVDRSKHRLI